MPELTLGVDLSDQTARLAVVDPGGQIVSRAETTAGAGTEASAIREAVRRVLAASKGHVAAIGLAMPNAFGAIGADLAAALRQVVRDAAVVPLAAGNAAAIAEQWIGAARGLNQVAAFSISDHVHAGILVNGEPWVGAHGFASSVSWLAMNPVEREDYRRYGSLEAEVSSAGIVRRFVWRIKSGDHSAVVDTVKGDFTKITVATILEASRAGDGVSISVIRDTSRYIGMAVANMATMFDPEAIVLGGVIAQSGNALLDGIRSECDRRLHPQQAELVRIVLSTLGHDAVALGAARAAARVGA